MKSVKLFFFLTAATLLAQEAPTPPSSPSMPAISASVATSNKGIMTIDAKARASDWVQVFDLLRRDKPTQRILIRTYSGMMIQNVIDLSIAQSGTLLIAKVLSSQGNKYQIVPVEEVVEVAYSSP